MSTNKTVKSRQSNYSNKDKKKSQDIKKESTPSEKIIA